MLQTLVSAQRTQFDTLAKAWLSSGATAVSVWSREGLVGHWPPDSPPQPGNFIEPIRIGNQTIGEIRVAGYQDAPAHKELAFTTMLISHLTELEFELELARQVQTGFLPDSLRLTAGLQIYGESRAAKQVNGDYYDFIQPEANQLFFAVGDVVNKGISAALLTAVLRKVIRTALKWSAAPSPKTILTYANTDMYDELDRTAMFATAFIGQFDAEQQMLTYVNAGHAPVIYRPARGVAQLLLANHPPLGVSAHSVYLNSSLSFAAEDLLVVASDGLIEARDHTGRMFGLEALLTLIDRQCHHSAQEIATTIFDTVTQFAAMASPADDQTLLILKGAALD